MLPPWALRPGRRFLLGAAAATLLPGIAAAYPTRPVRVVIGFGPGGLADITLRLVMQSLSDRLGQQFIVDNRPGAGGVIAAQAVAGAAPDGHTLIVLSTGTAISKALFRALPFDPVANFAPITSIALFDLILLARADSPLRSIADIRARNRPLNVATLTAGSTQYLTGEMFRLAAGVPVTIVPFRTTPEGLTALQRGDVDLVVESYATVVGQLRAGAVRALASSGQRRSALLPEVPTFREAGMPEVALLGWNALFAPAGTPGAVIDLLNSGIRAILREPAMAARMLDLGVEVGGSTAEELGRLLVSDIAAYNALIDRAGIERQ